MDYPSTIRKALAVVRPQFRLDYRHGIHGVSHWSRVWYHGRRIAATVDVNPAIPLWFAYLHDSQRYHDGGDRQHGARAADFATRLRRATALTGLSDTEFELLCEAMRLHSDGHTTGHPALRACWDADRLDLGRIRVRPAPHRLCTAYARDEAVIDHAVQMATARSQLARWR